MVLVRVLPALMSAISPGLEASGILSSSTEPSDLVGSGLRDQHDVAVHGVTALRRERRLDFGTVASAVSVGTASPYLSVTPTSGGGTDGKLSIIAFGVTTPVWTVNDQILRASANYSVLLVGPQAAPTGIVRRDR